MAADNWISNEALVSAMAASEQGALATLNQRYGRAAQSQIESCATRLTPKKLRRMSYGSSGGRRSRFDRSRGSVGAWIMMTVRSRAIDRLRARKAREPAR